MNNKLEEFINGIGALTEMWTVTYRGFINQGYSVSDALVHTREFTSALLTSIMSQGNKPEDNN